MFVFHRRMSVQNLDHIIYIECFLQLGMSTSQICAVFSAVYGTEVRRNQFSCGINCSEGVKQTLKMMKGAVIQKHMYLMNLLRMFRIMFIHTRPNSWPVLSCRKADDIA